MRGSRSALLLGVAAVIASTAPAVAAPTLRVQVDQRGDFTIAANTLLHDCGNDDDTIIVGTVDDCGANSGDTSPDIAWRSDVPAVGQAFADDGIDEDDARTQAVLTLPPGASVTHAYLYWAARTGNEDETVTLRAPDGTSTAVAAADVFETTVNDDPAFQGVADVTAFVQAGGAGAYRLSDLNLPNITGVTEEVFFAAWSLVVLYEDPADPVRNLAVFDGLDGVAPGNPQNVVLDGFLVPNAGFTGKLGVITYEGDLSVSGDQLLFGGVALFDDSNAVDNFFNSSRTLLGVPVTTVGDLPQLTGGPGSMSSFDADIVDITSRLTAGQTQASLSATSSQDVYYLGAFITSISTFAPDFTTSEKSADDVDGPPLLVGDVVEFTITIRNTGNDAAVNTVMTDPLPEGLTYVPGTLEIDGTGGFTEAVDADVFDFDAGTQTLVVRVGEGADGDEGGRMEPGDEVTVTFQVTIDQGAGGILLNQANITAEGDLGAPVSEWPTGSEEGPGTPTPVPIDECADDGDCGPAAPFCDTAPDPNVCVECQSDADCGGGLEPTCDVGTGTCVCAPTGAEVCDLVDNDCNGLIDDGAPGCGDTDGDGLPDAVEEAIGSDPNDADSDDDGVIDGDEPAFDEDTDGDGLINVLDVDSDDDGLFDGTEMGRGCDGVGTDASGGHCRADGDAGATTTDPLNPDTDGGGVSDGSEDFDLDGVVDAGETDPTAGNGGDDAGVDDADGDGLSDGLEETLGSDPNDADSDDDGTPDGAERNPSDDGDGDGLVSVIDVDSDDDGLFDGTESGFDCTGGGTDVAAGHCRPDGDAGATITSPVNPDTDFGGVTDGSEDPNLNGVIDDGELDPNDGSDDGTAVDTDGDGLTDDLEETLGSDPDDADSDDDGVRDGDEANPSDDTDGDGLINVLDPDSDGDGLFDGTEVGNDCDDPATEGNATCIADGDAGATTTSPVDPDTDDGGVSDGDEDTNKNGVVDAGETDPNDGSDDDTTSGAGGAGGAGGSGGAGGDGGAGDGGDATVGPGPGGGTPSPTSSSTVAAGGGDGGSGDDLAGITASGNGLCTAAAPGSPASPGGALAALAAAAAMIASRRRRG